MSQDVEAKELETFEKVYQEVRKLLRRFGTPDSLLRVGDYSVYGAYWGYPQVKVSIGKLNLLCPQVIKSLQKILMKYPGWEFVVAVANLDMGKDWPEMGLIVRRHEIIDGLQRQHFPKEFREFRYEGSRPGTDRD